MLPCKISVISPPIAHVSHLKQTNIKQLISVSKNFWTLGLKGLLCSHHRLWSLCFDRLTLGWYLAIIWEVSKSQEEVEEHSGSEVAVRYQKNI